MLDEINNNIADSITQNQSLDRINQIGATNPYERTSNAYFIDESFISSDAIQKYEHEQDIKKFSKLLMNTDEMKQEVLF